MAGIRKTRNAQPRVKLNRLRLWGCGAIFGKFFSGKIGLRLQSRRDSLRHRWAACRILWHKVKMAYKLQTEIGKAIYRWRKCTVEPVIGIIKEVLGFRQFSLRGLSAAAGEWSLVCLAFNLKRMHTLMIG